MEKEKKKGLPHDKFSSSPPPFKCFMIGEQKKDADGNQLVMGVELEDKYRPKKTGIIDVKL